MHACDIVQMHCVSYTHTYIIYHVQLFIRTYFCIKYFPKHQLLINNHSIALYGMLRIIMYWYYFGHSHYVQRVSVVVMVSK